MPSIEGYRQVASGVRGNFALEGLEKDRAYEVVVVPRAAKGASRGPKYGSKVVIHPKGQRDQPASPTNLIGEINNGMLVLTWDSIEARDRAFYEVRVGDSWWNAQILRTGIDATYVALPCVWDGTANVMVRSFNKSGVYSEFYASTSIESTLYPTASLDCEDDWGGGSIVGGSVVGATVQQAGSDQNMVYTSASLAGDGRGVHVLVYANVGVKAVSMTLNEANFLLNSDLATTTVLDDLGDLTGTEARDLYELDKHNYPLNHWLAEAPAKSPPDLLNAISHTIEMNIDSGGWEPYGPTYRDVTTIQVRITVSSDLSGVLGELTNLQIRLAKDSAEILNDHVTDVANPHATDLQDAFDAGEAISCGAKTLKMLAGSGNMINFKNTGDTVSYVRITNAGVLTLGTYMSAGSQDIRNVAKIGSGTPSRQIDFPSTTANYGMRIGDMWVGNYVVSGYVTFGYYGIAYGSATDFAMIQTAAGASSINCKAGQATGITIGGGSLLGGVDALSCTSSLGQFGVPIRGSAGGASINEFSTDGTMSGNSDTACPTEQAVVEFVDATAPKKWNINSISSADTCTYYDLVIADVSGGTYSLDLPSAASHAGEAIKIKVLGDHGLTVVPDGSETIDGDSEYDILYDKESVTLISDGSDWIVA